ncbi:signal transduction histidine kinase [Streptomyces sp. V3I8]|uniref:sensor histidine kinase n=1 Tax=Streptomyces sp. V3I8 TaxID=3042279 RepID=UPI0027825720|nr:ATP-binding protein [Streptomyces sp. V3I8]MDQ1035602.1 signal transduction histidine kinase [Streptomyces sp. V3I8]
MRPRLPERRSLRTRLLLFIGVTLLVVCTAMALTTVLAQRAYLLGHLDQRVTDAAERSQGGLQRRTGDDTDLGFLNERGQAVGTLAARFGAEGDGSGGAAGDGARQVIAAQVVTDDGTRRTLTAAQRTALDGLATDGSLHTRTIPGLGTYRVTAIAGDGVPVLTGLPMDDVQDMIGGLVLVEAVAAGAGLTAAGIVCAVVIRRQLRPLDRVAATAVEVSRVPLGRGAVTGLTRVREGDTHPGSEAGQVGAALNRMIDHVESSLAERQRGEERVRRFLADASHELRTPLASIAGYAELMNRGIQQIEPALAWRRVSAESARMTGLVEDLLLLARLDEGRPLRSAEVDLAALVAEAVWDARAAGSGHGWQLALLLDVPALVLGDEARLHQVVANLLANARVHTPAGTTVVASVEATETGCVVRVRDDGPGIPPHLLPAVFERFTRGDVSRSRSGPAEGGSGLGLAIVAAITTAHAGRVEVASEPGRTEFTLTLPRVNVPPAVPSAAPAGTPHDVSAGAPAHLDPDAPRTGLVLGAPAGDPT